MSRFVITPPRSDAIGTASKFAGLCHEIGSLLVVAFDASGQIHSALAYYWDHKDELDADIERRSDFAEQARKQAGRSALADKLADR